MVAKKTLVVGGIEVHAYASDHTVLDPGDEPKKDVVIFFFIHGRNGSAEASEGTAISIVEQAMKKGGERGRELVVVTFVSGTGGGADPYQLIEFSCVVWDPV
jgi:hypothetical protein